MGKKIKRKGQFYGAGPLKGEKLEKTLKHLSESLQNFKGIEIRGNNGRRLKIAFCVGDGEEEKCYFIHPQDSSLFLMDSSQKSLYRKSVTSYGDMSGLPQAFYGIIKKSQYETTAE